MFIKSSSKSSTCFPASPPGVKTSAGIHETTNELLTIITMTGVLYCKSNWDFSIETFVVVAPLRKKSS
jgi:hypothetical protein